MLMHEHYLDELKHTFKYYSLMIIAPTCDWYGLLKLLAVIGSAVASFFVPIVPFICAMLGVILLDTITGVWASNKKKIKIESKYLKNVAIKFGAYLSLILIAHVLAVLIISNWIPLVTIITGVILLVEGFSVAENVDVITDNKIFGSIFKKLLNQFVATKVDKDIFGNVLPKEEEEETSNGTGTTDKA